MSRATAAQGSRTSGSRPYSVVMHGDCVKLMKRIEASTIDFVLTDPPYLVNYRSRDGRTVANDNNPAWIKPAYAEMYRLLKPDTFCVTFCGWNAIDLFADAWKAAGFRIVGQLVFHKPYASSKRYLAHHHEQAYVLAKGNPAPNRMLQDVRNWAFTGNRLHPTQKPACILRPLIRAFCPQGGTVLDPFCGSGSTLLAARQTGRHSIGIELMQPYCQTASRRLA